MSELRFYGAKEIAEDQQISVEEASQLLSWLVKEARIRDEVLYNKQIHVSEKDGFKVTYMFYEAMKACEFRPIWSRTCRLVGFETLCKYIGAGEHLTRKLAKKNGWAIQVGRNKRYDLNKVDEWIDANRQKPEGGGD